MSGRARLCGHVGERVGGTVSQDVRLGHLQDGDTGGHFVQAAADHGFLYILYIQNAPAEPVVVPAAPLEGRDFWFSNTTCACSLTQIRLGFLAL